MFLFFHSWSLGRVSGFDSYSSCNRLLNLAYSFSEKENGYSEKENMYPEKENGYPEKENRYPEKENGYPLRVSLGINTSLLPPRATGRSAGVFFQVGNPVRNYGNELITEVVEVVQGYVGFN